MTKYDPDKHHRRSIRLKGYDYTQAGVYFVTIRAQNREMLLGTIVDDEMVLNEAGRMIKAVWQAMPARFPVADLDAFVIMPNHFHALLVLTASVAPPAVGPLP